MQLVSLFVCDIKSPPFFLRISLQIFSVSHIIYSLCSIQGLLHQNSMYGYIFFFRFYFKKLQHKNLPWPLHSAGFSRQTEPIGCIYREGGVGLIIMYWLTWLWRLAIPRFAELVDMLETNAIDSIPKTHRPEAQEESGFQFKFQGRKRANVPIQRLADGKNFITQGMIKDW